MDDGEYGRALESFRAAADLIPEPKQDWEASTWIYSGIGDALFFQGKFTYALDAFWTAVTCPDAIGNPFIHLRLGQCQFELGNLEKAADELARSYMAKGQDIFEGENEKYFEFLATRIDID